MRRFIKQNKIITACFVVSFVVISLYILSLNETEWFPHAGDWFNVLFQLSIGFVINFLFYVTQVYIPRQNLSRQANRCIQERIQNVIRKMDDIFRRIVEKYDGHYDESEVTKEKLLEVLHKMKTDDRINVVAASRSSSVGINENSHFTVKEWIINRLEFIEHEIDCIFKYYSLFVTPELMQVLEEILKSMMHTHIARITLQCPDNISFAGCNEDVFLTPYFELMKKLESLKKQYQ
jgi:hypothetical protein